MKAEKLQVIGTAELSDESEPICSDCGLIEPFCKCDENCGLCFKSAEECECYDDEPFLEDDDMEDDDMWDDPCISG